MGWLIAAGVLVIICLLPLSIRIGYDADGASIYVYIGPVRVVAFPKQKSVQKGKKEKQKSNRSSSAEKKGTARNNEKGGKLTDFLPLLEVVLELLSELRRRLVIKDLEFKLVLTGEDPCDLSINYGRAWSAIGNIFPLIERYFILKKRNIDVSCDYISDESYVFVRVVLSITIGRLLLITIFHGSHALKQYIKIINKRKGGANT